MSSLFELVDGGLGVMPHPGDNPENHMVPHHESGARVSFEVLNVGDAGGNARVGVEIDDVFVSEWQSQFRDPGSREVGYVGLGRLATGEHVVLGYINPGSGRADHSTNRFEVE